MAGPAKRVIVIGGGPAGYNAALTAAHLGAAVTLVENDKPGGQCVHYACIPTGAMLSGVRAWVDVQELSVMGVVDASDTIAWPRLVARKDALVARMASGVQAALRQAGVTVVAGGGTLKSAHVVRVSGKDGSTTDIEGDAIVLATGSTWDPPELPGVATGRIVTADVVHALPAVPTSTVVLGGGPAATAFAVEQAFLFAAAGSSVTLLCPGATVIPALDGDLDDAATAALTTFGITVLRNALVTGERDGALLVQGSVLHGGTVGEHVVAAEVILCADPRRAALDQLGLSATGVARNASQDAVGVDRWARTNVPTIFAAGDVVGGAMLSSTAAADGIVAGWHAAGGPLPGPTRVVAAIPHVLHTVPEIAWIGITEADARCESDDVATATADLGWTARSITAGGREGIAKLVVDRTTRELLGLHVVGDGAAELVAAAATAMQSELTVDDIAAQVHWHPSAAETLAVLAADAAR